MSETATLWIDTDVALGAGHGDVDDGFALAAVLSAARQGKVTLAGISTVFGNTSAEGSEDCARKLSELVGVRVPLFRGAEREGERTAAAEQLAALPEGSNILALGPSTNVAAACRIDPSLPSRVTLRVVGGNLSSRGFLPPLWPFEFNLARDREAAREVFSAKWNALTLFPLDVVSCIRADPWRLRETGRAGALGEALEQGSRRWRARARWRYLSRSFPLWDLPAALDAIGQLAGGFEACRPCWATRRLIGKEASICCLVRFDPEETWKRFVTLLVGESCEEHLRSR